MEETIQMAFRNDRNGKQKTQEVREIHTCIAGITEEEKSVNRRE